MQTVFTEPLKRQGWYFMSNKTMAEWAEGTYYTENGSCTSDEVIANFNRAQQETNFTITKVNGGWLLTV